MDVKVTAIQVVYNALQEGGSVPKRVLQAASELKVPVFICDTQGNRTHKVTLDKKGQQSWEKIT